MPFIFTEMIRCGEIGRNALVSFLKYHPTLTVHVFAGPDDILNIPIHKNIIIHTVAKDTDIYKGFDSGHLGTAKLWQRIFADHPNEQLVHFDSDVFFLGDIVHDILNKLETHDLVGSFRPYRLNPNNMDSVRMYADVVQTYCVGINTSKITIQDPEYLRLMIQGHVWKHPVIDFFDPVSFHILENGGSIEYLDVDIVGGVDQTGGRLNKYPLENKYWDIGEKIIHFAGVGSGRNFYNMRQQNMHINVPESYVQFGIERYDVYSRVMFGTPILSHCKEMAIVESIRKRIYHPIHAFYINLDDRNDRKGLIEKELCKINCTYEKVPAIKDAFGLIGCAKSHIKCLKLAKERGLSEIMIVEDDLEWIQSDLQNKVYSIVNEDFDVAVLCPVYNHDTSAKRFNSYFVKNTEAQTTVAYICKNHYYDTLINNLSEGIKYLESTGNSDMYALDQYWKLLQRRDTWIFAYPTLGKQRSGFSDICMKDTNYDTAYLRTIQCS